KFSGYRLVPVLCEHFIDKVQRFVPWAQDIGFLEAVALRELLLRIALHQPDVISADLSFLVFRVPDGNQRDSPAGQFWICFLDLLANESRQLPATSSG